MGEELYSALQKVAIPNILNHNSFRYKTRADGTREYYKRRSNLIDDQPLHSCVFGLVTSPKWGWDVRPLITRHTRMQKSRSRIHVFDYLDFQILARKSDFTISCYYLIRFPLFY